MERRRVKPKLVITRNLIFLLPFLPFSWFISLDFFQPSLGCFKYSKPCVTLADTIISPSLASDKKSDPSTTYPKLYRLLLVSARNNMRILKIKHEKHHASFLRTMDIFHPKHSFQLESNRNQTITKRIDSIRYLHRIRLVPIPWHHNC